MARCGLTASRFRPKLPALILTARRRDNPRRCRAVAFNMCGNNQNCYAERSRLPRAERKTAQPRGHASPILAPYGHCLAPRLRGFAASLPVTDLRFSRAFVTGGAIPGMRLVAVILLL